MRSLFVTMYRRAMGLQSTQVGSTNQTGGTKPKHSYINQPSSDKDDNFSQMELGHCGRGGIGTSAVAYNAELASGSSTGAGDPHSDNDELLQDRQMGIMKKTEVRISETWK